MVYFTADRRTPRWFHWLNGSTCLKELDEELTAGLEAGWLRPTESVHTRSIHSAELFVMVFGPEPRVPLFFHRDVLSALQITRFGFQIDDFQFRKATFLSIRCCSVGGSDSPLEIRRAIDNSNYTSRERRETLSIPTSSIFLQILHFVNTTKFISKF